MSQTVVAAGGETSRVPSCQHFLFSKRYTLLGAGTRLRCGSLHQAATHEVSLTHYQLCDNSEAALLACWNNGAMKVMSYKHPQATILSLSTIMQDVAGWLSLLHEAFFPADRRTLLRYAQPPVSLNTFM